MISMGKDDAITELRSAVLEYDSDAAVRAAKAAIKQKIDPMIMVDKALVPAINEVGDKFEKMEIFLPDLMLAADAVKASMALILPLMAKDYQTSKATVVVATVQGDVHEIGKNIIASMLMARGFNVIDMGVDVKTTLLIDEAKKSRAKIICASALMSSTMGSQKDIIDYATALGDRKRYAILVGGGPTSREWADEIKADGWGKDANGAIKLADKFSGRR